MESNDWTDAERRVERAAELFEQRKLDEALQELQYAVNVNPFNAGWLYNLGLTLDELGRRDEAIEAYAQALDLEPEDVATLHRLGASLHRTGRVLEAIDAFDRIERIQSDYEPAYCHRVAAWAELGDHEKAEEVFYLGRLVREHCPACYFAMGCSLAAREQWDRAIYCWQRTLDLQPAHAQVHARLAEAFWQRGELDRARKHLLARLRQSPRDGPALLDLVELLLEMGRTDEAGERIAAIPSAVGNASPHVQFARGSWLLAQARHAEAADAFGRALRLDPTFPRAHLRLGQVRLVLGQQIEAKTHLRSELLLRPDDPGTLFELSNLLIDTGELRSAVTCLRRLVSLRPNDATAWQNLGVAHFLRSQHDEGLAACRKALEVAPAHAPALHNLATALGQLGRHEEALAAVRAAPAPIAPTLRDLELRLRYRRLRARVVSVVRGVLRLGR